MLRQFPNIHNSVQVDYRGVSLRGRYTVGTEKLILHFTERNLIGCCVPFHIRGQLSIW